MYHCRLNDFRAYKCSMWINKHYICVIYQQINSNKSIFKRSIKERYSKCTETDEYKICLTCACVCVYCKFCMIHNFYLTEQCEPKHAHVYLNPIKRWLCLCVVFTVSAVPLKWPHTWSHALVYFFFMLTIRQFPFYVLENYTTCSNGDKMSA